MQPPSPYSKTFPCLRKETPCPLISCSLPTPHTAPDVWVLVGREIDGAHHWQLSYNRSRYFNFRLFHPPLFFLTHPEEPGPDLWKLLLLLLVLSLGKFELSSPDPCIFSPELDPAFYSTMEKEQVNFAKQKTNLVWTNSVQDYWRKDVVSYCTLEYAESIFSFQKIRVFRSFVGHLILIVEEIQGIKFFISFLT